MRGHTFMILGCLLMWLCIGVEAVLPVPRQLEDIGDTELTVQLAKTFLLPISTPKNSDDSEAIAIINACVSRYLQYWFGSSKAALGYIDTVLSHHARSTHADETTLDIEIGSDDTSLHFGFDESYRMVIIEQKGERELAEDDDEFVTGAQITIYANSCFGIVRAFETLSQLLVRKPGTNHHVIEKTPIRLSDTPDYPWRGLMIDTARHYYPIASLQRIIEAMSWAKLNTFHWHIADDESFPFESFAYRNATLSSLFAESAYYSVEDIRSLISFAHYRGVRIIPELPFPSHLASLANTFPHAFLSSSCHHTSPSDIDNRKTSHSEFQIDFFHEDTQRLMNTLIEEVKDAFSSEYVHAAFGCIEHPTYREGHAVELAQFELATERDAVEHIRKMLVKEVSSLESSAIIWQDFLPSNPLEVDDSIVMISDDREIEDLPFDVIRAIEVNTSSKYDHLHFDSSSPRAILGGEAIVWSDKVDASNVELYDTIYCDVSHPAAFYGQMLLCSLTNFGMVRSNLRVKRRTCNVKRRGLPVSPIEAGHCDGDVELQKQHDIAFVVNDVHFEDASDVEEGFLANDVGDDSSISYASSIFGEGEGVIGIVVNEEDSTAWENESPRPDENIHEESPPIPPAQNNKPPITVDDQYQYKVSPSEPDSDGTVFAYDEVEGYGYIYYWDVPPLDVERVLKERSSRYGVGMILIVFSVGIILGIFALKTIPKWPTLREAVISIDWNPQNCTIAIICIFTILFFFLLLEEST